MLANQLMWGMPANAGLECTPMTWLAARAAELADSSPAGFWSEKLRHSRWSLPEHTIHLSSLCPFWSPASRLTLPSISAGMSRPPEDLRVASGW